MILYTVMPSSVVLEGLDKDREFIELEMNGCRLVIERISENQGQIERIISSSPMDYLDPTLAPGTVISLN